MKKGLFLLGIGLANFAAADQSYLTCQSINHNFKRCYSSRPITRATLREQLSDADCVRGDTWGFDSDSIWVDEGCRGEFRLEHQANTVVVDMNCESWQREKQRCYVDGIIQNVTKIAQYSGADCDFGETWAWDDDYLLVTEGCRGRFRIRYRPY